MLVHPHEKQGWKSRASETTLVDRLASTFGREGHVVTRLDRQVSGISIVAFDKQSCTLLQDAFKHDNATKVYYALCFGEGAEHVGRGSFPIDRPLRDMSNKNESLQQQLKPSVTQAEVLWSGKHPDCCFVRAEPKTGRFHQIRRHLQSLDLPILGERYNNHLATADWESCGLSLPKGRVLLHLHRISLPETKVSPAIDVTCPLPPDFRKLLQQACPKWVDTAASTLPELFAARPPNLRYSQR
eukprot:TRINITY_DN74935_c0_g1_i1.p1 TRINITY_DN74935_c0_g1~~TRINITY_DN74935_c0_g1_i1.p1  ORF type:complete len:262 (-),score=36.61 TRINITY_DN74935_c0_g1_i1:155-880(-)